ncbi:hypothetical protein CCUS01_13076 [Colletotrichum cuscutae]|uniref:Uncharacterized protein n=1 Tax=Colletotrichum cuscutae TaxID=1209917 RepID=A0AAI9YCX0_9PEZI|nr:hypothetical protein CCUS01_13076 [Colletotrichum cuscutae]
MAASSEGLQLTWNGVSHPRLSPTETETRTKTKIQKTNSQHEPPRNDTDWLKTVREESQSELVPAPLLQPILDSCFPQIVASHKLPGVLCTGAEKISSIRFITPSISSPNFAHLLLRTKVPSFPAVTRQSSLSIPPKPGQVGQRLFPRPHVAVVAHVHGPLLPGHVPVSSFEKQDPSTRDVALGQEYLHLPPNSPDGMCTVVSCFFQRVSRLPCITRAQ